MTVKVPPSAHKKSGKNCCDRCAESFQRKVVGGLERFFFAYGRLVSRYWWAFLLGSFIFSALLTLVGMEMTETEDDGLKLWLPEDSEFRSNSEFLREEYPSYNRHSSIILVAKEGNMLTADNLRIAYALRKKIGDIDEGNGTTWEDRCQKRPIADAPGQGPPAQGPPAQDQATQAQPAGGSSQASSPFFPDQVCAALEGTMEAQEQARKVCMESHILEIWANDGSFDENSDAAIEALSDQDVLDKINEDSLTSGLTGAPLYPKSFLGTVETDADGKIKSAKAMKLSFIGKSFDWSDVETETEEEKEEAEEEAEGEHNRTLKFEKAFIDTVNDFDFGSDILGYPNAARSFEDTSDDAGGDLALFLVGYILVALYAMVMLGKFNSVEQRVLLSLMGIVSVFMGYGTAYGVAAIVGFFASNMNSILPFLLLGIGIDDMFVIVQSFETLSEEEKKEDRHTRFGYTMKHGGVAITITTVTDLMAFAIGSTTVLPALSSFCVYAALGIFFVFFYMITFFFALFSLDQRRAEDTRDAIICCWKKKDWTPNSCSQKSFLTKAFVWYANNLVKIHAKIVVMIFTAILLGVSIWGTTQLEPNFDETDYLQEGSYLTDFIRASKEYFPSSGGMSGSVYVVNVDDIHERMDVVKELGDALASFDTLTENSGKGGFDDAFEDFVDQKIGEDKGYPEQSLPSAQFHSLLAEFMFTVGTPYQKDVSFKEELKCSATAPNIRMLTVNYKHKSYDTVLEHVEKIDDVNKLVDEYEEKLEKNSEARVFAMGPRYGDYLIMKIITQELVKNILLALLCVFLATLFLIANVFTSLMVVASVLMSIVDVGGFMHLWGLSIDTVASLLITIALGLSVDYSAHIAHAFMVAAGTRDERVRLTLTETGPAVFNGGFSTFLAFALLMTSKSYIFLTFFKIFFLIVTFGLYHGLVFLPVLLSLVGPSTTATSSVEPKKEETIQRVKTADVQK